MFTTFVVEPTELSPLSAGARPSVKDNEGFTPFLITEKADVVKYLLDNGYASIHESNNEGQTAIMFAASNGGTNIECAVVHHALSLSRRHRLVGVPLKQRRHP